MSSRKEELLAKKARLAELKRQRELRQSQFSTGRVSLGGETASPGKSAEERRSEIDSLVSSLIDRQKDSVGSPSRSRPSSFYGSGHLSPQHGGLHGGEQGSKQTMQSASTQTMMNDVSATVSVSEPDPLPALSEKPPKREYITYSKGVQTEPFVDSGVSPESDSEELPSPRRRKRLSKIERERDEEIREKLRKEIEEELKATANGETTDLPSSSQRFPLRTLTDTELNAVTTSTEFQSFIERSSKVIERALDEEYDLLADYTRTSALHNDDDDDPYSRVSKKSQTVRESLQLYSEQHSRRRMITDLHFSPHFNELLLTSYTKNPSAPNERAGLVLLWNTHAPSRPEYVFTAGTDVLSARFSPFHPNLVVGGCYSGQICLWDTRSSHNGQPVQKTPQSGEKIGHTHAVYNVSIVGTPNAHNILTSSMDGTVCSWSFDMLTQAQEYLELSTPAPAKTDELAPTCMSFPNSDPTFFLVGTEEGNIYPCHRYDRAGATAGVDTRLTYKGHSAPVMSTQFHPARGPVDLGDLMLSTSSDWSIKLWRIKPAATSTTAAAAAAAATSTNKEHIPPILDLPCEDLVYDAKWSPHKPSVFAAVTGAGELQIYDLTKDFEVPIVKASPVRGRNGVIPFKGLNKVAWEERKGGTIATGGLDGIVTLFDVGKGLRGDAGDVGMEEWVAMKKLVNKLDNPNLGLGTSANDTL